MKYVGDFLQSATVRFSFNTRDPASNAAFTLAGTPAISIYKSGSTTEVTTGVTLTVDYDSRTGYNHVIVDMSSDTTFYSAATDFRAVITAGTVNGTSVVGIEVAQWSCQNRSAVDTPGTTTLLTRVPALVPVASDYTSARAAKLDNLDATVSSRLASASYVSPPSAAAIAAVLFVDGSTNQLKVNADHSVNSTGGGGGGGNTIYVQVPAQIAQGSIVPTQITAKNYCTLRRTITLGTITGWSKIVFTIKAKLTDADADSLVQIVVLSSGPGSGLTIAKGAGTIDPTKASLNVTDATVGSVDVTIDETIMGLLTATDKYSADVWGAKAFIGSDTSEPVDGPFVVLGAVTRTNT